MTLEENKGITISNTLSNLIAEANFTIQNSQTSIKEKILQVYNYAIDKDGFSPVEARTLIKDRIVNVSSRYIREVLPDEAKQTEKTKKSLKSNEEQFLIPHKETKRANFTPNPELEKFRQERSLKHTPQQYHQEIPTPENDEDEEQEKERTWQFKTTLEIKGQDIPLIVTVYPDSASGKVEVDEQAARRFNKRK